MPKGNEVSEEKAKELLEKVSKECNRGYYKTRIVNADRNRNRGKAERQ